jgi:hypothetical protein
MKIFSGSFGNDFHEFRAVAGQCSGRCLKEQLWRFFMGSVWRNYPDGNSPKPGESINVEMIQEDLLITR